jgi:hypothetical protein
MPYCCNTQAPPVEISRAPPIMANQVPPIQTNFASPLTTNRDPIAPSNLASAPISISPELQILTNEPPTSSAGLGRTHVSTIQIPRISSSQAATPGLTFHTGDGPARLCPHISQIWSQPTDGIQILPALNYQHLLNPDTPGISQSTNLASSSQKTNTTIITTAPVSPLPVQHVQANLAPPLWSNLPRPTLTSQVSPVIASMSYPLPNMVAPRPATISPGQTTHLHTGRSQSFLRNLARPILSNWAPPVQTTSFIAPPPSHGAFNYTSALRSPFPHIRHLQPHIPMRRPRTPQVPLSDLSYNVPSFGGSISEPNLRSGRETHFYTDANLYQ